MLESIFQGFVLVLGCERRPLQVQAADLCALFRNICREKRHCSPSFIVFIGLKWLLPTPVEQIYKWWLTRFEIGSDEALWKFCAEYVLDGIGLFIGCASTRWNNDAVVNREAVFFNHNFRLDIDGCNIIFSSSSQRFRKGRTSQSFG